MVEGGGSDQKEELFDGLRGQALLHAMVAHGRIKHGEFLQDGGDGVRLRVIIQAAGSLPEASRFHARNPLQALMLQHTRNCWDKHSSMC